MKTILLIDANSLIHRSFHALPPLTDPNGNPVGALYGLSSILIKILREQNPEYVAATFDRPERTFRKEMFEEYKAKRPKAPDELIYQIKSARELFSVFGIKTFEIPSYEADDIIGTLTRIFSKNDTEITILTGDLDTLQLVDDKKIVVKILRKGVSETVIYDELAVKERYGINPNQITDYKGLVGDQSDNIPGVKGVGPKTAEKILNEFGTIDNFFSTKDIKNESYKKIIEHKEVALLSKKLGTIDCYAPINVSIEDIRYKKQNEKEISNYFNGLGFSSLLKRIGLFNATNDKNFEIKKNAPKYKIQTNIADVEKSSSNDGLIVVYDLKEMMRDSGLENIQLIENIFDVKIAAWLIKSDQKDFSLETISGSSGSRKELIEGAFLNTYPKLVSLGLMDVLKKIEMPLVPVLYSIEKTGIRTKKENLLSLKKEIENETKEIEKKIYEIAGENFNINSPKQVGFVLFDKLKLQTNKKRKTKGGAKSTAEDVLFELKKENKIASLILEYRENSKILSTYVDPILSISEKNNGIIKTTLLQTNTSTGRLSSEKPNLQNIPQDSKWSRKFRKSFVPRDGFKLVSFDYSQLELRLLAHISQDKKLIQAFKEGKDIHTLTAQQVFNLKDGQQITPQMRRLAKTLNFGVVYGMGARAFSEASETNIEDSKRFIEEYFHDFPDVKKWQEKTKQEMRENGYVKNINGRIRFFDINKNINQRINSEYERAAINMPVQSLGADILKTAMNNVYKLITSDKKYKNNINLLLSIHDELMFEVRNDILIETAAEIKKIMENSYNLSVPLKVDIKSGPNWGEMSPI